MQEPCWELLLEELAPGWFKEIWRHLGLGGEVTVRLSLENKLGHEQAALCSLESPRTDPAPRIRSVTRGQLWVPLVATKICFSVPLDAAQLERDEPQHSYLWPWLCPWAAVAVVVAPVVAVAVGRGPTGAELWDGL